jgi:hypothetical protein
MIDFVSLLYADQSLDALESLRPSGGVEGHMQTLYEAHRLELAGMRDQAAELLRQLTQDREAESRVRLWAATALRSWEMPPQMNDPLAHGAVVSIAAEGGKQEVIAAYRDGSMRYVVNAVPLGIYQGGDPAADHAITVILEHADRMLRTQDDRSTGTRPRITLLTLRGNEDATRRCGANELIGDFAKLLNALVPIRGRSRGRQFAMGKGQASTADALTTTSSGQANGNPRH